MSRTSRVFGLAIAVGVSALVASGVGAVPRAKPGALEGFVRARDGRLEIDGSPYHFVGANLWYGMNLGAEPSERARLGRELDRLASLGVNNLRIMASTQGPESEPWRIVPVLETSAGVFDEKQLRGLDWLLVEMGKRGQKAVVCLGNFWPWSGGMSQYLSWNGAGAIPYPPPAGGGDWGTYQTYTEKFYSNTGAMQAADRLMRAVVGRVNSINGVKMVDDPTIMAWELANEPRGGANIDAFNRWLRTASDSIRSLDPNHLITTGSEGLTPVPALNGLDVARNHSYPNIDYVTAHAWAQNWGWFDPAHAETSLPQAISKMDAYVRKLAFEAARIGKPLVFEEFGIGRDGGSYDPAAGTAVRDRYYQEVFDRILELASQENRTVAGVNFWAWAGEARPESPFGGYWKRGLSFIGDPPHEAQGWYSIYDADHETQVVIGKYARLMSAVRSPRAAREAARQ